MRIPAISVSAISRTVAGLFTLFESLSGRHFRISNTSQELLDFFEADTTD